MKLCPFVLQMKIKQLLNKHVRHIIYVRGWEKKMLYLAKSSTTSDKKKGILKSEKGSSELLKSYGWRKEYSLKETEN